MSSLPLTRNVNVMVGFRWPCHSCSSTQGMQQVLHVTNRCHYLLATIQTTLHANLKQLNRHVAHALSHAKATWYAHLWCQMIHDMNMEPCRTWEHICILTKGESTHHQCHPTMAMQLPDGMQASNAADNMSVFAPHFQCVLNNHHPVKWIMLIISHNGEYVGISTILSHGTNQKQ